jgi:antitoxin component of MazEF toxin-antitoxin module
MATTDDAVCAGPVTIRQTGHSLGFTLPHHLIEHTPLATGTTLLAVFDQAATELQYYCDHPDLASLSNAHLLGDYRVRSGGSSDIVSVPAAVISHSPLEEGDECSLYWDGDRQRCILALKESSPFA